MCKDLDVGSTLACDTIIIITHLDQCISKLAKEKELKKLLYLLCFHIRKGKGQITRESL